MFKTKTVVGLDIGTSSIKLVEIKRNKDELRLERVRVLELLPTDNIAKAVSRILKLEKISCTEAVISISGRSVFSRFVKLPRLAEHKIDQIVKFEAQQQIPFPIEEVVWDYHLLKKTQEEGQVNVILVAVKKDIVEQLVKDLYYTNLNVDIIDVGPYALHNIVDFNNGFENTIILDIGAKTTNVIISREGKVWTRNLPIAGDDITMAIAEGLDISLEAAEKKKREDAVVLLNEETGGGISKFITPVLTDLLTEVSRSIGYYKSQFDGAPFSGVILTGGTARLKNIDKFFEKNLKLETHFYDFSKKIKPKSALVEKDLARYEHLVGVAFGLALRAVSETSISINLIPSQLVKIRELEGKRKYIFGCGILAIASLLLLNAQFIQKNKNVKLQIKEIEKISSEYENFEKKIDKVKNKIEPVEKELALLGDLAREKNFWIEMFSEIAAVLGKNSWLTKVNFENAETIIMEGQTTGSFAAVTRIEEGLEKSAFFEKVETLSANVDNEELEDKSIKFVFKAVLENQKLKFR